MLGAVSHENVLCGQCLHGFSYVCTALSTLKGHESKFLRMSCATVLADLELREDFIYLHVYCWKCRIYFWGCRNSANGPELKYDYFFLLLAGL